MKEIAYDIMYVCLILVQPLILQNYCLTSSWLKVKFEERVESILGLFETKLENNLTSPSKIFGGNS